MPSAVFLTDPTFVRDDSAVGVCSRIVLLDSNGMNRKFRAIVFF
jgi:hypothetical protein